LAGVPQGFRCATYPCLHVESHDVDWLSDREDKWSKPYLHMLMWTCCRNPEVLQTCREEMRPARFAKLEFGYQRCLRLEAKWETIEADLEAHERHFMQERLSYFAYWESFTADQLAEFRKGDIFNQNYERYIETKVVWEEDYVQVVVNGGMKRLS